MEGYVALCPHCGAASNVGPTSTDGELLEQERRSKVRLTPRQRAILELVQQGYTNKQIAGALFLSPNTVKYHLKDVYQKLGARSKRRRVAWRAIGPPVISDAGADSDSVSNQT